MMKVRQQVILQKQRGIRETVWLVLDKAQNEGFEGRIIAECCNEKNANAIAAQAAEIARLREFVGRFVDNFDACDSCGGGGFEWGSEDACGTCGGTCVQIKSRGMLLSELLPAARALAGQDGG